MRCLGYLVGCFFVMLIMVVGPISLWVFTVWNTAANPDAYTESLDDEAYNELAILTLPVFAQLIGSGKPNASVAEASPAAFGNVILALNNEEWRLVSENAIAPEWVKEVLNSNVTNAMEYLQYNTNTIQIEVDTTPIITMVDGEKGEALIGQILEVVAGWDTCSSSELSSIETFIAGDSRQFIRCNPGQEILASLREYMLLGRDTLVAELHALPDGYRFNLREQLAEDNNLSLSTVDRNFHDARRALFFIDNTLIVILLFPVMLMALVMMFAIRSVKEFFFWVGLSLIGVGLLTFLPLVPWVLGLLNETRINQEALSSSTLGLWSQVHRWLFSAFASNLLIQVGLLLIIGMGMMILAGLLRGPEKRKEQQPIYYVMPGSSQQLQPVFSPESYMTIPPQAPVQNANFSQIPHPAPTTPPSQPRKPLNTDGGQVKVITPTPVKASKASEAVEAAKGFLGMALPKLSSLGSCEDDGTEKAKSSPIEESQSTGSTPPPASQAERFKDVLDDAAIANDQTFIPTDTPPPSHDPSVYTPKNKLTGD